METEASSVMVMSKMAPRSRCAFACTSIRSRKLLSTAAPELGAAGAD